MKKRLIGGIVATAILIPVAAFAASGVIDMPTRTPMTSEQVKVDEVGKSTLEKLYLAYPETKSFEIIDASNVQGDVSKGNNVINVKQTSIVLQEKGGTGKKITLHTNGSTDEIEHVIQENWEPKEKSLITLTDQEIKAKVSDLIDKMYGNVETYEVAIEQMENPNQKTWMLNYTNEMFDEPVFQVFVQDNTISLTKIVGIPTADTPSDTPSNIKVEGLFSINGKPDYSADNFLNDEKLFALLKISPTELKQELAKGKTVVEIAASKNVTKQQVIDVIAETQARGQLQGDGVAITEKALKEMMKAVEPKVVHIIEHKTETEW
ncbi:MULTISPECIES: hypothetical protein [Brevibacillus]|uniref:hypothetical protein n=1 Tax=Brevibacillus TaxID=55080 RepID=UPI000D10C4F7|nr:MULTISPECIES: hypothetical protein [Brevibacillus]MED1944907.1 hypothetical protein [Brevibacillus formosus]MED1996406.1 hypothetical protein [Brevibacillus formosus]MED2081375.1 hypothetical protein [Brevibacillus formosus]PSK19778.1 hypothetical protein C7R94_06610 [Brevibacillus sp. NRRL NRS-603]